jgi:predicted amidophosphoribosyltransferase
VRGAEEAEEDGPTPAPPPPPPPPLTAWDSAFVYEGIVREVVARLKYRNERALLPALADRVAAVAEPLLAGIGTVVVSWPPTTAARRRERGFDHAELLARRVATRLRLPVRATLKRHDTTPQTGRTAADRRTGPVFTAKRAAARRQAAPVVLLVDDVATTGATLSRAAQALLRGNAAKSVIAVTIARTPLKH